MLIVNAISIYFSGISLLENISFNLNEKHKVGLIGKNGVGKSTILKALAGQITPQNGKIVLEKGKTMGYLPQEIFNDSDLSIVEEVKSVFKASDELQQQIDALTKEIESRTDYESESYLKLTEELSEKASKLGFLDENKKEGEVEKILKGLGFKQEDFTKPLQAFSGGWQMRVELSKILIQDPDILLLDEPTNHLDIESIIWLENYLKDFGGAIIMISHDRQFLDNITNRTIEIVNKKIYDQPHPYSKFMLIREERIAQQLAAKKNQDKYIAQQERFIERFKAKNTKAKQAASKQKALDKIERVEVDQTDDNLIQFRFPPAPRSGDVVLKGTALSKAYDQKQVLKEVAFLIERGEKVAFVGQNGQGKSTLVKMIMQEVDFQGEVKIGHNVEVGYYAQQQEKELDPEKTIIQTIEAVAKDEWTKEHKKRGLLGAFLFGENDINKKIKVLSGGEKARVALALMLMQTTNLLVMDEPTNHLDMASKAILKQALADYNGALILVSHDRDFLKGLTDKTFEFKNGRIKEHLGSIDEFLSTHKADTFRAFELKKENAPQVKASAPKKQHNFKALKKLKSTIERMERKIEEFEAQKATLEQKIAKDGSNQDLFFKHAALQKSIDLAMQEWEHASEEYDTLNA